MTALLQLSQNCPIACLVIHSGSARAVMVVPAAGTQLSTLEAASLPAYARGLQDEGCAVALETLRCTHALLMLVFWGLSAVPLEVLFGMAPPGPAAVVRDRARAAAFVLDLVEAAGGT